MACERPFLLPAVQANGRRPRQRLTPRVVVEVGSGLGELLSRIDAVERHAYDVDPGVVRAGRFLHGRRVTFVLGDATTVIQARIDVLVMVNWIHNLSPSDLEQLLMPLVARTRYLVLDAIDADAPGSYRHKHDFAFLDGVAERLSVTRAPDEPRGFHLFRVIGAGSGTSSPAAQPPGPASVPAHCLYPLPQRAREKDLARASRAPTTRSESRGSR